MAVNVSQINTRENFQVKLSIARLKELFVECFNGDVEDDDFNISESKNNEVEISLLGHGEIDGIKEDDFIIIKDLNNLFLDIFVPIFEETKVNADMFVIWDEGYLIELYKFRDGFDVDILEINLFDFCNINE